MTSSNSEKKSNSTFIFKAQKKEFLDWLESLRISKYWLDTLSIDDSYALCKEILEVLENFNELELIAKEKLFALIEIYGCLKDLCQKLQETYIKSEFPLTYDHQKYADIITQAYMALANAYYEVVDDNDVVQLSKLHIALAICRGFQALSFALLSAAKVYKPLPSKFWPLCYRLYSNAEVFTAVNTKVKMDENPYSIALLLKQILILHTIDTNQLTPLEIQEVAIYSMKVAHYIDLKQETIEDINRAVGFYFEQDEPPKNLNSETTVPSKTLRYININYIVKVIQFIIHDALENKKTDVINIELLKYVIKIIINKKQDKSKANINKEYRCYALIGIHNVIDFLLEKEEKKETERHQIEKSDFQKKESLEDDINSLELMFDWDEDQTKPQVQQRNMVESLQIIGSSIEGYQLFGDYESGIQLQIGQTIGVIPDFRASRNRVEVGLVRRISITDNGMDFNVELLGLESTLIQIEKNDTFEASEWEIFLFGSPKYDVSILCNQEHEYTSGENISVLLRDKKIPCKLGEFLNSTPLVNHIALSYL